MTSEQPEVTIGFCGHVDHGKTTLLHKLSGKWTDTHSEEVKRGITIRLGYADSIIYKKKDGSFTTKEEKGATKVRKVSFIDAPGHESLMATMLSGAAIMDAAIVLVAANESVPQPQTREHLMALEIIGVTNVIVVQNKIDLVDEKTALEHYKKLKEFLADTPFKDAPIVPISAQYDVNLDVLLEVIQENVLTPDYDTKSDALFLTARSFDINKPGTYPKDLQGGVLGGVIKKGIFKPGDTIELKPGIEYTEKNQKVWKPLTTTVTAIMAGGKKVTSAHPGGSLALLTTLDPSIVKSDSLGGSVVGIPGKLPPTLYDVTMDVTLLKRVVGSRQDLEVKPIHQGEMLMLNVNAFATVGMVSSVHKGKVTCKLKRPICAEKGERITISRLLEHRFRLIGYGIIA